MDNAGMVWGLIFTPSISAPLLIPVDKYRKNRKNTTGINRRWEPIWDTGVDNKNIITSLSTAFMAGPNSFPSFPSHLHLHTLSGELIFSYFLYYINRKLPKIRCGMKEEKMRKGDTQKRSIVSSTVNSDPAAVYERQTIGYKLPQDAINPAHGSLLRVNSPSHGIFSGSGSPLYSIFIVRVWERHKDGVKVISGSVCKVRTQDTDNFDEEVKPLASARWIDFGDN